MQEQKRYSQAARWFVVGGTAVAVAVTIGTVLGLIAAGVVGGSENSIVVQACVYTSWAIVAFIAGAAANAEMDRREREGRA